MSGRDGGPDATEPTVGLRGILVGRRLVVRDDPVAAVRNAVAELTSRGFVVRPEDLDALLRGRGSPWTACAVEIGSAEGSWRRGVRSDLAQLLGPLAFSRRFDRGIPPTLVVVAARAADDGASVLDITPHASWKGHPEDSMLAAPRVRDAIAAVADGYDAAGLLVDHGRPSPVPVETDSPAHPKTLRTLLRWP